MKKTILALGLLLGLATGCFSQGFYDINTINTIEITFTQSNWDYLLDQLAAAGDEERLLGSVSINGQFFDSVGVRYKGNSSYNANQVKNPLNIKLDYIIDNQEIENYGTIKLSNVYKDPSFVREVLSYEIARKYLPAGLSNYAKVYVNGTYLGLYTSDQDVDKFFMRTHFLSDENARIKGEITGNTMPGQMGGVWEYYGADSSLYVNKYALESDYGWNELVSFLDTLNNYNTYVDQVLNIDRHLWFLAFENTLVNLDSPINNPQNYYLYKDDAGRMNPIPWDLNESFGVFTNLQGGGPLGTTQLQHLDPFVNLTSSIHPVISKVLSNATYRKMYVAHMKTMLEENFSNGWYEARGLEIQNIIDDEVQADPNKFYTYANFTSNLYNAVGGGPNGGIIGIVQLMSERATYLNSLTEFQYEGPAISSVSHSPEQVSANSEVWITATVTNETSVKLAYRSTIGAIFDKIDMVDDGNHHDGVAGDGIFGVGITTGTTDIQYYIYAENLNAVSYSPARAEYEFYNIEVTLATGDLVINEFMADNESTVTDPAGEYADWVELYNNGTEAINLNGYYLSDKESNPAKWSFPDVTIEAGGYLIVWADEDEDQEGLHSNFKLSASGESLVLSDPDLNLLDQIDFGPQKADTSTGRYPNGTGEFGEMLPTFEAENNSLITGLNSYPELASEKFTLEQNFPNPFSEMTSIRFNLVKGDEVNLKIINMLGETVQVLVSEKLPSGEYMYQWNADGVSPGIYFYSMTVGNQVQVKKMVVN